MVVIAECVFCFLRKHMHVYDGIICVKISRKMPKCQTLLFYISENTGYLIKI